MNTELNTIYNVLRKCLKNLGREKSLFYVVPWKSRLSFLLLPCCHYSSGIESHKRKESNNEKSGVVIDQSALCGKDDLCLYMKREAELAPTLLQRTCSD